MKILKIDRPEREKQNTEGTKCEVYSRAVGYLRPVSQWNPGKKEEFSERKCFKPDVRN
ncbi:MAG TPA: hypothetical protein ENI54_03635 [bacterium]|nr:hypothetical protein [bacterium]